MFGQQVAIELGGVLRTTIRVVDAALWRLSYSDGRLQCRNSNAGIVERDRVSGGATYLELTTILDDGAQRRTPRIAIVIVDGPNQLGCRTIT